MENILDDDLIPRAVPKPCQLKNLAKPEVPELSLVFDDSVKNNSICTNNKFGGCDNNEPIYTSTIIKTPRCTIDSVKTHVNNKCQELSEGIISPNHATKGIIHNLYNVEDIEPKLQDKKKVSFSLVKDHLIDKHNLEFKLKNQANENHTDQKCKYGSDMLFTHSPLTKTPLNKKISSPNYKTNHFCSFPQSVCNNYGNCNCSCNRRCINIKELDSSDRFYNCESNYNVMNCSEPPVGIKAILNNEIHQNSRSCNCDQINTVKQNQNEHLCHFYNRASHGDKYCVPYDSLKPIFQKIEQLENRVQQISNEITDSISNRTLLLNCQQFEQQLKMHQACCANKYDQLKSEILPLFELYDKIEHLENKIHSSMLSNLNTRSPNKCKNCNPQCQPTINNVMGNKNADNAVDILHVYSTSSNQTDYLPSSCRHQLASHDACKKPSPINTYSNTMKQTPTVCCSINNDTTNGRIPTRVENVCTTNIKLDECQKDVTCQTVRYPVETFNTVYFNENCTELETDNCFVENSKETPKRLQNDSDICNKIVQNVKNMIKIQSNVPSELDTTQLIKNITHEYLQKLNLSTFTNDNVENKRPKNTPVDIAKQKYEKSIEVKSSDMDSSLRMNSLAMKYFSNEFSGTNLKNDCASNNIEITAATNVSDIANNISCATLHYLQRYQLLPLTNETTTNKHTEVRYITTAVEKARDHNYDHPRESSNINILDAATIRQQPKFL